MYSLITYYYIEAISEWGPVPDDVKVCLLANAGSSIFSDLLVYNNGDLISNSNQMHGKWVVEEEINK
jgi:hypothetical protein